MIPFHELPFYCWFKIISLFLTPVKIHKRKSSLPVPYWASTSATMYFLWTFCSGVSCYGTSSEQAFACPSYWTVTESRPQWLHLWLQWLCCVCDMCAPLNDFISALHIMRRQGPNCVAVAWFIIQVGIFFFWWFHTFQPTLINSAVSRYLQILPP